VDSLATALQYLNIAAFGALAYVCFRAWRARRGRAAFWAFATFGLLALVAVAGPVVYAVGNELWATKVLIALVVVFPYFLYRFAASFGRPTRWISILAAAPTAGLVAWSLTLPDVPSEGEPRTASFTAFVVALLVQWTALSLLAALRLWAAGSGQPTVVRYRMWLLALGAIALSVALVLAGVAAENPSAEYELVQALLALLSSLLFFVGFAPPKGLRKVWREPEEHLLRRSMDELLVADQPKEVMDIALPQMADLVGATAVALLAGDGRVLGTHGVHETDVGLKAGGERLELPEGALVVWTSASAPLFGQEEFELLRSLGSFALLAYERKSYVARQRQALEEADQLKTNFIALASHELRTPAAVIHGIAATLSLRAEGLTDEQQRTLRHTLYEQTDRMRRLVDQLLDLSRLEANGIRIEPQTLHVRTRIEELVSTAAADRTHEVTISVPSELEALVDPNAFDRIVVNLIVNAARYGAPPIEIAAEQRDRHFRLSVRDHGRGVPPEFVPQLFERFSRSKTSRVERVEGAGLGLAIAKSYAQAHGGDLLYEEARPNGARFELVLPTQLNNG
jgi:signal transduction histidine kinase